MDERPGGRVRVPLSPREQPATVSWHLAQVAPPPTPTKLKNGLNDISGGKRVKNLPLFSMSGWTTLADISRQLRCRPKQQQLHTKSRVPQSSVINDSFS